jgi:acetyltransferase-like isoleucine patch superfamily enzyme
MAPERGGTFRRRARNAVRKSVTAVASLQVESRSVERGTVVERDVRGLENLDHAGANLIARGTTLAGPLRIGYCTLIHPECELNGPLIVGAYTHLSSRCAVYAYDHPVTSTTPYANDRLFGGATHGTDRVEPVRIEDSVWVGHATIVLGGVTIGRGTVVGAGAVVTASIPPYSIAVGNPSRVVRRRFSDAVIEVLESSRWWDLRPEQLEPYRAFFTVDLTTVDDSNLAELRGVAEQLSSLPRSPAETPPR